MEHDKRKFCINSYRLDKRHWSIGSCLSHEYGETYIFINLLFFCIAVGYQEKK